MQKSHNLKAKFGLNNLTRWGGGVLLEILKNTGQGKLIGGEESSGFSMKMLF